MPLGTLGLSPGDIELIWDPTPPKRGNSPLRILFSTDVCYDQTAGWIKMPLGMEAGLGPGQIVSDGNQPPPQKGHSSLLSAAHVYCGQTVAHLSNFSALLRIAHGRRSLYFSMGAPFPKIAPFQGGSAPNLIHDSLGQSEPTTQTASPLVQPFSHR